ncbi:MAG: fumarate hydratase [Myxococcota bacterium]|nr:fumarate hydratase [Myxococcota bacterium]
MANFQYEPLFQPGQQDRLFRKITSEHVEVVELGGEDFLQVAPEALSLLAREAFRDLGFLLRTSHLEQVASILRDPEASENDRFVARELLRNAVIAAEGIFPSCQDTGTATIMGKRGDRVLVRGDDAEALSRGVWETYAQENLRYSQVAALSVLEEKNTRSNLPAQIDLFATKGMSYDFLFVAKGGGSANKFYLFQETKALLREAAMREFLWNKLHSIGTAACPPYHLAFVIGGLSAEMTMKTTKLATTGYLDHLPTTGNEQGRAFRDLDLEQAILAMSRDTGIGAQFGGKYFCHDVRVIRLPRHGASCPIGMGVSCSADRNILGRIDREGLWVEQLETNPARLFPEIADPLESGEAIDIDLRQPMDSIRAQLSGHPVGTALRLTGPMVVARDIAHARLLSYLEEQGDLPAYIKDHPVYYAGPAKTPEGHASGSFGPTTAQRMDSYVQRFQAQGGSLVMLAKGNRSKEVAEACGTHGGFYLGSIGGPAARLGRDCITQVEIIDYPELGMEAVHKIEVENFPAFIVTDDQGNDFFARLKKS